MNDNIKNIVKIILSINTPSQARYAIGEIDGENDGFHALDWHTLSHLSIIMIMVMVRMKR